MKKVSKSNPLKTFNDNKAMAYKKAGGAMSAYKKSLKKAKEGKTVNPPKGVSWIDKGLKSKPKYEPEALVNKGNPVAYGFNTALKNLLNPTSKDKLPNMPKHKTGGATKFGMLSVKAGIDKNPKPTAADRIAGAKKKKKK